MSEDHVLPPPTTALSTISLDSSSDMVHRAAFSQSVPIRSILCRPDMLTAYDSSVLLTLLGARRMGSIKLNADEFSTLSTLLGEDQRSIGKIMSDLDSKFPSSPCIVWGVLSDLLKDKTLLNPSQRMVAFCLLHQAYSSLDFSDNPFISLYINAACDEEAKMYERALVLQLLETSNSSGSGKEVFKQSVADYIKGFNPSFHVFPSKEHLQAKYGAVADPSSCLFRNSDVKIVIPDPVFPPQCDAVFGPGSSPETGSGDRDETGNLALEVQPPWIRPPPPLFPIQDGELIWLNPENSHELVWDRDMCDDEVVMQADLGHPKVDINYVGDFKYLLSLKREDLYDTPDSSKVRSSIEGWLDSTATFGR